MWLRILPTIRHKVIIPVCQDMIIMSIKETETKKNGYFSFKKCVHVSFYHDYLEDIGKLVSGQLGFN